ncbi:hypothetical protein GCM10009758_16520 [Microbacterium hatanonis]
MRSVAASCCTDVETLSTSVFRRNAIVPTPAANSPIASRATVTPVTFARRLTPRHQLVTASCVSLRMTPDRA